MDERPQDPPPPGVEALGSTSLPEPPKRPKSRPGRRLLVALVAGLALVVGGGAALAYFVMRGAPERLVGVVPSQADVFVTVYLDPSAGQKANLLGLARRFPDLGTDDELQKQVDDVLDQALADGGLAHDDVRPWLGSEIGLSVDVGNDGATHVALLVATTDTEASQAALEKAAKADSQSFQRREYDGVQISVAEGSDRSAYAIVNEVVVLASDETTVRRAIDAAHGTTPDIGTSQVYLDTVAALPDGKLGVAFVNVAGLVDQFGSQAAASAALGAGGLGELDAIEGLGMSLSAETDGLALDVTTNYDPAKLTASQRDLLTAPDHDNATLAFVPADAFAVMAQEHMDTILKTTLDQIEQASPDAATSIDQAGIHDLLAAMTGDLALEVGPAAAAPVSGALLVGTDDPETMATFLQGIAVFGSQVMAQQNPTAVPPPLATEEYQGVKISYLDDPTLASSGLMPAYAVMDRAGVIATSPQEIHQLIDTQASGEDVRTAPVFSSATATVPSTEGVFFLDVQAIAATVRENLPPDVQAIYDRDVAPNLAPVTALVVGSESDEQHQRLRVFLQMRGSNR
ncbi:MAG: DUF3352 domain-containing protein [Actinomycetota bacterium]